MPAPAPESKSGWDLPPAEIWSAQPIPKAEPETVQTPVETVIMPESHPYAAPAQAYPLEETEEESPDPSPDDKSGEDA